ncbi:hypothetical protein GCM10009718_15290 [Isoptericola halotolerans]|uniref:Uncharacterized protein n=1 Tax=Isoptericola halotolerans TaxID=300560 RepID=A0ABX1ZYD6_9MICO|nr:hypothetical protein [Isoptericola halotolerans]NOV95550.1 hypothetical protein [Isoptericola halotolerans]
MRSPGTGLLREVRALLLAAAIVLPSLGAHVLAGGSIPGAVPLLVALALTAVIVRPLCRREVRLPWMLAGLGVGQVLLHVGFEQGAALTAHPAHHHGHVHDDPAAPLVMLAAHVLADVVIALGLRYGESLLWRWWRWWSHRIPTTDRVLGVVGAARRAVRDLPVPACSRRHSPAQGRAPPVIA